MGRASDRPTGRVRYWRWLDRAAERRYARRYADDVADIGGWIPVARLTKPRAVLRRLLRLSWGFCVGFASPVPLDDDANSAWHDISLPSKERGWSDGLIHPPWRFLGDRLPRAGNAIWGMVRARGQVHHRRQTAAQRAADRRSTGEYLLRLRKQTPGGRRGRGGDRPFRWRPTPNQRRRYASLIAAFARACVRQGAAVWMQLGGVSGSPVYSARAGSPLGDRIRFGPGVPTARPVRAILGGRGRYRGRVSLLRCGPPLGTG